MGACLNGNISDVSRHIREGADVNQRSDFGKNPGWAPIHAACKSQNSTVLVLLLYNGADVNLLTNNGLHPLQIACAEGAKEIVQLLCECGADANVFDPSGVAPIHHACKSANAALVSVLLRNGANVNLLTQDGSRPLHIACAAGAEKIVRIKREANALNANEMASLQRAYQRRNPVGLNAHLSTASGTYPLEENVVRTLLNHGADVNAIRQTDGSTPLHLACSLYLRDLVDLLLEQQSNVDTPDFSGLTPLHVVVYSNWWRSTSQADYYSIIQSLLKHGADVNACK